MTLVIRESVVLLLRRALGSTAHLLRSCRRHTHAAWGLTTVECRDTLHTWVVETTSFHVIYKHTSAGTSRLPVRGAEGADVSTNPYTNTQVHTSTSLLNMLVSGNKSCHIATLEMSLFQHLNSPMHSSLPVQFVFALHAF